MRNAADDLVCFGRLKQPFQTLSVMAWGVMNLNARGKVIVVGRRVRGGF